jgi:hypothetical protein
MWSEVRDHVIESPDFIRAIEEKIVEVRENLRIAQSRQKSYADKRRWALEFEVGDHVYPKVSPIHGHTDSTCAEIWPCGTSAHTPSSKGLALWHTR